MLGEILQWIKRRKVVVMVLVFSFIVSGLIINVLELATLPLYFINKKWFRIINAKIVYLHWCVIPWALESWANSTIDTYVDESMPDPRSVANKEHAIVTMNHPGDLDWMFGWVVINRVGMLGGTKAIMKDVARFLPGIGWTFLFMEYPLLKRDWTHDQSCLVKACENLKDYPINMLLCLFAEGTRFTKEKHRLSMDFARSRGYPVLKHHLFPRTKGFCLLMKHLRQTVPAIYDITIVSRGDNPSLLDIINAKPSAADVLMRRFPTADLPESAPDLAKWLINLYKEKDDLVDYHIKHERFPERMKKVIYPTSCLPDLIVLMWVCLLGVPAVFTALYLAWVGAWLTLGVILAAVFVADQLFQYLANETVTEKSASSYGLQSTSTTTTNTAFTTAATAEGLNRTTPGNPTTSLEGNKFPSETKKDQ